MITERKFSVSYTSLWREITPSADNFIRHINLASERFVPPYTALSPAELNGPVNESAFRLSREIWLAGDVGPASEDGVCRIWSDVCSWLGEAPQGRFEFSEAVLTDIREVATSIGAFLRISGGSEVVFEPPFRGCGSISSCVGDLIVGSTLVEIKAGDRGFRAVDLRQLFTYAALARSAGAPLVSGVCLLNPRWGVVWHGSLDEAAVGCGAQSSIDLLDDIVRNAVLLGVSR
ncbi:hypothetical protein [Dyella japonica]|uniref:PD-(D/E)XK endonuclease-like domain-containing protein n=1 Tax=Dyella japonica TaxID=231455 RepID=A0ABV2JPP5_9GAMM